MEKFDILLVSTADWDNPFWTNKQHVAVELARRGHRILYVESSGIRTPTATARDMNRIWRRLKRVFGKPRRVQDNIWVWSPILIPWHAKPWVRFLNKGLLALQRGLAQAQVGFAPKVMWTYWPLTTYFYNLNKYNKVIFHSVDDIKEQPGTPRALVAQGEVDLATKASIVFTTAPHLCEFNKAFNANTHYFNNVADFAHFNRATEPGPIPADLESIPHPRIGFVGAISGYKQNLELIRQMADRRPNYHFVLIGDIGEGDPLTNAAILKNVPNIHLLGPKAYKDLPDYLRGMDVGLLPSHLNDYTRSMFPMKFFEYLAAGLPVISTRIPALADHADLVLLRDSEDFEEGLDRIIAGDCATLEQRLAAAREQTYEARTEKMLRLIEQSGGVG